MNTEKMSHVVSMTANVGVLIGLSLLVYELNQNNQHMREQATTVAVQGRAGFLRAFGESPEVGRLMFSHLAKQPLTEVDKLRRQERIHSIFVEWQWQFERERSGLIKQFDALEQFASAIRGALVRWNGEDAWRDNRHTYRTDFREFMDTQVVGPG